MRVAHGQQEAVIQALANLAGQLFDDGEVEDQLILVQGTSHLHQHAIVMPVQPLALPTKRDEMGRAKFEIATLYFYLARNVSFCHICSFPSKTIPFCKGLYHCKESQFALLAFQDMSYLEGDLQR